MTSTEAPLPLPELDRLLSPLRRTLAYAMRDDHPSVVRYLEVNAGRFVRDALQLDLPQPIREQLAHLAGGLDGYDAAGAEQQRSRLATLHQSLARVDAVLGLPLSGAPAPTPSEAPPEVVAKPRKSSAKGSKKGRGKARSPARPGGRSKPGPTGPWLGAEGGFGRPLGDLGLPGRLLEGLWTHGIESGVDLLWQAPVGEEVVRPVHGAGREVPEGRAAVGGRIRRRWTLLRPDGSRMTEATLHGAAPLRARWLAGIPSDTLEALVPGERAVLVGQFRKTESGDVLEDAEVAGDHGSHAVHLARYGLADVDDQALRAAHRRHARAVRALGDPVPDDWLAALGLPALGDALAEAHLSVDASPDARRRLAFDEAVAVLLCGTPPSDARERGIGHPILHGLASQLVRFHDLELTDGQQRAFEDIKRDLRSNIPMMRVLTGEVGMGPGHVATMATVIVAESKSQVLVLCPDRASAESRFLFTEPLLREVGLVARLVEDDPGRALRDGIRRGEVHVVFGTTRLLETKLECRRLGLVISEEAGPWRVAAPLVGSLRPPRPDTLVLTPTPVPATALLRALGDHDLSVVDRVLDRQVPCEILPATERVQAYERVAERVAAGAQAWVLFPLVRGHDALDVHEAHRVKATLESQVFPGSRVGLFHGGLGREERFRMYRDFSHHRYDVVVSTTLVEDGAPLRDATVAIVEQADKLSHARTSRIRGHLARGGADGLCLFILGDDLDPAGAERLEKLIAAPPFAPDLDDPVSDADLPEGALPAPRTTWLDLRRDRDLVLAAHRLVRDIARDDPGLRATAHADVARHARLLWPRMFDIACPLPEPRADTSGRRRRRRRKRR